LERDLYTDDHEQYREAVKTFLTRSVVPHHARWEAERWIDRSVFVEAARQGVYGLQIPEEFGGAGESDYRYRMITAEEIAKVHALSFALTVSLQDDLVLHYLIDLTTDNQKRRWLPGFATGQLIGALAMTEPDAGSDLRGMRTNAHRDGEQWILSGQKTFISSGIMADIVIVAARTVAGADAGSNSFSLFVVERDMAGFTRGRKLDKIGLQAQDTAELFFDDVAIPPDNLLGTEGRGLQHLMSHLPRERLGVAVKAIANCQAVFDVTRQYCFERKAFNQRIGDFQHVRFELAEMATEIDIAQAYVDKSVLAFNAGTLTAVDAAKGKWYVSELQNRVMDRCVQLHGGSGYMTENPVARAYVDTRIQTIYGGTTAIMKEIIGRDLAS
jgi:alkylation response protein AidB-like acyl-CoA dehydrogenase